MQVSKPSEFFLSILTQNLYLGKALHVLFLFLSGSHWTTSSSLLLLMKGEFTFQVLLSESSLKLPPSESKSFTISLILSVMINIFLKYFLH